MSDEIKVEIKHFGKPIKIGDAGYVRVRAENIIAFYLDVWTDSGRAYPVSTCREVYIPEIEQWKRFPGITLDNGDEFESDFSEVYFPEFEGWSVHCVTGGKVLSICLVKKDQF
jgi:hypothetical protein